MKMKIPFCSAITLAMFGVYATPYVTNVVAKQRYPWNGKVDISFDLSEDCGQKQLEAFAVDKTSGEKYYAYMLTGDIGAYAGHHNVVWDLDSQGIVLTSMDVQFSVSYQSKYRVFEIGSEFDKSIPFVQYTYADIDSVPVGGWSDEYKTTKLVLRRCPAGRDPLGRYELTKPFYIGVFEVTEAQWEIVYNGMYTGYAATTTSILPICAECTKIRSPETSTSDWPNSSDVGLSFVWMIRKHTSIPTFDLPTCAQWEYACRAGTTTTNYLNVASTYQNLNSTAWLDSTNYIVRIHSVGEKIPNPWGLYDLYGNVAEMCLDLWSGDYNLDTGAALYGKDPKGISTEQSSGKHCSRGGGYPGVPWNIEKREYNSFFEYYADTRCGFRICYTVE